MSSFPPRSREPGRGGAGCRGSRALHGHRLCGGDPHGPAGGPSDLTSLLQSVQVWIWGFVGLAAIVMLSVVALMFILSGGHPGTVMKAKNGLRHVVYGLALLVLAPLLVNLVISVAGG